MAHASPSYHLRLQPGHLRLQADHLRLQADAGVIALKTIAAFTFLGYGVVGGKHLYPKLEYWLSQISFVKGELP